MSGTFRFQIGVFDRNEPSEEIAASIASGTKIVSKEPNQTEKSLRNCTNNLTYSSNDNDDVTNTRNKSPGNVDAYFDSVLADNGENRVDHNQSDANTKGGPILDLGIVDIGHKAIALYDYQACKY